MVRWGLGELGFLGGGEDGAGWMRTARVRVLALRMARATWPHELQVLGHAARAVFLPREVEDDAAKR